MSPEISARAQKNEAEILSAMRSVSQNRIAELMGTSPTTISRMKEGEIAVMASLLAACGLKVVREDTAHYPLDHIAALTTLARAALDKGPTASSFGDLDQ